ncbi:Lipid droplet-associated hydrolase [Anthophora quadrimaculata]
MYRATLKLNGVPTKVIAEGCWVEEGLARCTKKDIVILLTGNPGVPDFYEGFVKTIRSRLPSTEVPIWIVGHAGHTQPSSSLAYTMPSNLTWDEHYGLMAQVQHKKDFINKYVPEDGRLHLIGHSIGCWMILNLLKDDSIAKKVTKCYMLFPTIEHMAETNNGWYFTKIVPHIIFLLTFFAWIFSLFPNFLQNLFLAMLGPLWGVPAKYHEAVLQMLNPYSVNKICQLACEEMKFVKNPDDDIISKHAEKLWFYYGNCDGWTPIKFYQNIRTKHPDVNAQLCKHGYGHAFVLRSEREMGKIVGDVINGNLS